MERGIRPEEERAIVAAFVSPPKQDRYMGFLRSGKTRKKLLSRLPHFSDFDPRVVCSIRPAQQHAEWILGELLGHGAGHACYAISSSREFDQVEGSLKELLEEVVGFEPGTIISCVPGRLAYFEGEANGDRCILKRL